MTSSSETRPRRGRPRRIDRERIIEAAKGLDPATLTMQALADEMGVDRKTLHYHVDNRASLIRLVAADAFREALVAHDFAPQTDWRDALRSFAVITRDAVTVAGAWASYVSFETEQDLEAVRPAEAAIQAMVAAGLPEVEAGRVVALCAVLAYSSARDQSFSPDQVHPQERVLDQAFEKTPQAELGLVRRLVGAHHASLGSDEQFTFELNVVMLGVERLIREHAN